MAGSFLRNAGKAAASVQTLFPHPLPRFRWRPGEPPGSVCWALSVVLCRGLRGVGWTLIVTCVDVVPQRRYFWVALWQGWLCGSLGAEPGDPVGFLRSISR